MTLLWIILAFITLCGIVAVCGKWFVYAITTMAAVIWTPIQETYRLHKGGEKKKFQELATSKGIKNGSTITIIGTRGSYNGKIEVMNAYFVSVCN